MNILAISPHPDDAELGCGASLSKFISEGHKIYHAALCAAENIGSKKVPVDSRWEEFKKAQRVLGIANDCLSMMPYTHRKLYKDRSKILDLMIGIKGYFKVDMVFTPCINDLHQDHAVATAEALRVFKGVSILGYEMVWNNLQFKAQSFIKVSSTDMQRKIDALAEYKTQADKPYMQSDFSTASAKFRGVQIGTRFAEAFEVIRWVQ